MARRKLVNPTKAVTYRIDESLAAQFELLLLDPVSGRGSYGLKSLIVETMLRRLIDAARHEGQSTIEVDDLLTHLTL